MGLPNHAKDDGKTITFDNCPYIIKQGFREMYLKLADAGQIPPDDQPLCNEYGTDEVEKSNPKFWQGGGTAQETRYFRFGWSSAKGVIRTYVGQELKWYQQNTTPKG